MHTNTQPMFRRTSSNRTAMFEILAATLSDLHHLPPQQAVEKVNRELAANPMTAGFKIESPPVQEGR